tara:strand:+ start:514 stop:945 length:432 start_codon:yes stop_codon:yes gene_type:complete
MEQNPPIVASPTGVVLEATQEFTEDLVNQVMTEVKENLGDIGIKPTTLTLVIKYTMEAIEKTPTKGPAQLNFALRIISDLINELPESEERAFLRQTMDNGGVKDTIELVVQATRGEINVNQITEIAAKNCLGPCVEYIISKCR